VEVVLLFTGSSPYLRDPPPDRCGIAHTGADLFAASGMQRIDGVLMEAVVCGSGGAY